MTRMTTKTTTMRRIETVRWVLQSHARRLLQREGAYFWKIAFCSGACYVPCSSMRSLLYFNRLQATNWQNTEYFMMSELVGVIQLTVTRLLCDTRRMLKAPCLRREACKYVL